MHQDLISFKETLQNVGFFYPVIDGRIFLGQRGTPPYECLFGPFGGKCEAASEGQEPLLRETHGGHMVPTVSDSLAERLGYEYGHMAAVREFFEEAYQLDADFSRVSHIISLGGVTDVYNGKKQNLQLYVGFVEGPRFNPKPREIRSIRQLDEIAAQEIYPLGIVGLVGLKFFLTTFFNKNPKWKPFLDAGVAEQIPPFTLDLYREYISSRPHSVIGALYCPDSWHLFD